MSKGPLVLTSLCVKQRSRFGDGIENDGFPAKEIGRIDSQVRPPWVFDLGNLPSRELDHELDERAN